MLQRFEYTPFGQTRYVLNASLNLDPSYTGQAYDVDTGLYYYKSRFYDPKLGRFIVT
jgi:RHS repeat-associated protein